MADDVAGFQFEDRPHFFQGREVQIDRAGADGAAAGLGHPGSAGTGQKRSQGEHRGAHGAHEVVGGLGFQTLAGLDGDGVVLEGGRTAEDAEKGDGGLDVAQARHVGDDRSFGQKRRGKQDGQGGVFGAADTNGAGKGLAAVDTQFIHVGSL